MSEPSLPRNLRAVIFDVDGTLYQQRFLRRAMALTLVRAHLRRPLKGLAAMRILRQTVVAKRPCVFSTHR